MIGVAYGPSNALRLVGLIAVSDPPREDTAELIAMLRELGVRTVMVTGDSPVTGAAIARIIHAIAAHADYVAAFLQCLHQLVFLLRNHAREHAESVRAQLFRQAFGRTYGAINADFTRHP